MINVLTDLAQSLALVIWLILMILLQRRINRLDRRINREFATPTVTYRLENPDPQPICGCKHHQCFHDENGCGGMDVHRNSNGYNDQVDCGCKRYAGPEQLPKVIP